MEDEQVGDEVIILDNRALLVTDSRGLQSDTPKPCPLCVAIEVLAFVDGAPRGACWPSDDTGNAAPAAAVVRRGQPRARCVLFPLLAAFAPAGTFLTALTMRTTDRWQGGAALLQAAPPAGSAALATVTRFYNANNEPCRRAPS